MGKAVETVSFPACWNRSAQPCAIQDTIPVCAATSKTMGTRSLISCVTGTGGKSNKTHKRRSQTLVCFISVHCVTVAIFNSGRLAVVCPDMSNLLTTLMPPSPALSGCGCRTQTTGSSIHRLHTSYMLQVSEAVRPRPRSHDLVKYLSHNSPPHV